MNNQPTRRRQASRAAARTLAVATAMAALVAIPGAGQALATVAPPDERVLERRGRLDNQAASQADEQPKAGEPTQGPPTPVYRRFFKPEPPMDNGPRLDADEQLFPTPAPPAPASDRTGLVISLVVAALLLAAVAATTWRIHHRRPRPEPTGPLSRTGSLSTPATPSAPHQG